MNRKSGQFSRRKLLRGAGAIAIALPLIPEWSRDANADVEEGVPCRLFTASFGLGIEESLQLEKFEGPLQPLQPFASQAALFTNVDAGPLEGNGTPHFRSAAATFTGVPQRSSGAGYLAGGPSMEQVMKRALHPQGVPEVSVPSLSAGLWSRTGAVSQFTRHWNLDGSPGPRPERRPSRVFTKLFGSLNPGVDDSSDPELLRRNHIQRSVLDSVLEQYKELTSKRSALGNESKERIKNHLAAIRDVERQLVPAVAGRVEGPRCMLPAAGDAVDPSGYSFYDRANGATGNGAPAIGWKVARDTMAMMGKLLALGISCDAIRFGSLIFVGGGGHVRFGGSYQALGQTIDFSAKFGNGTPHDKIFHSYDKDAVRLYQHFAVSQLSHLFTEMEAIREANGKTVLNNSLVLMASEYGKNHDATHTFHAVLGGGGRLRSGWYGQKLSPSDVYHAALASYGVDSGIAERWPGYVPTDIAGFRLR